MKNINISTIGIFVGIFSLLLIGCQNQTKNDPENIDNSHIATKVEYLADKAIWNYPEEYLYRLAFSFQNAYFERISSNATANITIINSSNETVYSKSESINSSNFAQWSFTNGTTKYLCTIDIPHSQITKGLSSTGTILFTIILYDQRQFEQSSLSITSLPQRNATIGELIPFSGNISVKVDKIFYNRNFNGDKYQYLGNNIPVAKITLTNNNSTSLFVSSLDFHILDQTNQIDYEIYSPLDDKYDETGTFFIDNESKTMLSGTVHTIYITFDATNQLSNGTLILISSDDDFPIRVEFNKNEIK